MASAIFLLKLSALVLLGTGLAAGATGGLILALDGCGARVKAAGVMVFAVMAPVGVSAFFWAVTGSAG